MNYLSQFLIITTFSLIGEILHRLIPVPIPASVYGIVLLFAALCLGSVKLKQIREVGGFLRSILPLLFVSPVVGILENWAVIKDSVLAILLLAVATTALTFAVSGRVAQWLTGEEGKKHE